MIITNQLKNQHLLWRAGFGPRAEEIPQVASASQLTWFNTLRKASSPAPSTIDVADDFLKGLLMGMEEQGKQQRQVLTDEDRRKIRRQNRDDLKSLNLTWLNQMVDSSMQLREKMALFWHGHFACRNINIFYQQLLLDVIRKNALGNFGDLLRETSKTAAMINFLNNNQNRKGHPNENFAREVMELFTMGRGNYTENDIKEGARAFTGWGANAKGEFVFRKLLHDDGTKTFLHKTGNFDGDDVLNILLEQRSTARFISGKVYRYFVNEQVDETKVEWLASRFFQNGYDIAGLMKDIFTSDWFYDEKNIGTKIKSPVELMVGIRRILPMKIENEEFQLLIQRVLGQVLFYPPNVAGWPGGRNWIDSSSLMFRLRIPQLIQGADEFAIKPKDDDDQMMGMKDKNNENAESTKVKGYGKVGKQQIKAEIDWTVYTKIFEKVAREKLPVEMAKLLLQTPSAVSDNVIKRYANASTRDSYLKTVTIQLMSTPEYQLC